MRKRILVVHGILTHGDSNVDRLASVLAGEFSNKFDIVYHEFPIRFPWTYYFPWGRKAMMDDARTLINSMNDGDHIVCHSYGALVWQNAIKLGAKFGKCFIIAGAATSDKMEYPVGSLEEAHVFYNPKDMALKAGAMMPFHPFGKLGYTGFAGSPGRVRDSRFFNVAVMSDGWTLGHSHYFGSSLSYVMARIRKALGVSHG